MADLNPEPGTHIVHRIIDIVMVIGHYDQPIGASDVSRLTNQKKPTVVRYLDALARRGILIQETPSGKYRLGSELVRLGYLAADGSDYALRVRPHLQMLATSTGETAHYAVLGNMEAVYVQAAEGTRLLHLPPHIGKRLSLYASSVGKILISWMTSAALEAKLSSSEMDQFTLRTIDNIDALSDHLAVVRERCVAYDDEESEAGFYSIAAAIRDHTSHIVGALSIGGPVTRVRAEREELTSALSEVAAGFSRELGYALGSSDS